MCSGFGNKRQKLQKLRIKKRYRENDTLGGYDPYSASKASAEIIIQSYIHSFS